MPQPAGLAQPLPRQRIAAGQRPIWCNACRRPVPPSGQPRNSRCACSTHALCGGSRHALPNRCRKRKQSAARQKAPQTTTREVPPPEAEPHASAGITPLDQYKRPRCPKATAAPHRESGRLELRDHGTSASGPGAATSETWTRARPPPASGRFGSRTHPSTETFR
jgi:hypothetical protein